MDYYKMYSEHYTQNCNKYEEIAIKSFKHSKKDNLDYQTALDNTYYILREAKYKSSSILKENGLEEAKWWFYKYTKKYTSEFALKKTINIDLMGLFNGKVENIKEEFSFEKLLVILATYFAADYLSLQIYKPEIFNEKKFNQERLRNFSFKLKIDPILNLRGNIIDNTQTQHSLPVNTNNNNNTKSQINNLEDKQLYFLVHMLFKEKMDLSAIEFARLIQILSVLDEPKIFDSNYSNSTFYKITNIGIEYFKKDDVKNLFLDNLIVQVKSLKLKSVVVKLKIMKASL